MTRAQAALLTGVAALAGVSAASLGGAGVGANGGGAGGIGAGGVGAGGAKPGDTPLWAAPGGLGLGPAPCIAGPCWSSRARAAMLWRQSVPLAAAAAGPARPIATAGLDLRVPLADPMLLGDAPVVLSLSYAFVRTQGWAGARIDAQAMAGRRRFEIIGARTGGDTMTMVLPAEVVRAEGGVTLHVALTVRTLGDGRARLALRSVALAEG